MSYGRKYVLNDQGNPIPEPDLIKWARWFETAQTRVANEVIDGVRVSTVFLSLDANFGQQGPPVLWETMVLGGRFDLEIDRCSGSREQAEAMHAAMVARVKAAKSCL